MCFYKPISYKQLVSRATLPVWTAKVVLVHFCFQARIVEEKYNFQEEKRMVSGWCVWSGPLLSSTVFQVSTCTQDPFSKEVHPSFEMLLFVWAPTIVALSVCQQASISILFCSLIFNIPWGSPSCFAFKHHYCFC